MATLNIDLQQGPFHAGAAPDLTTVLVERLLISLWHLYLTGAGHAAALFGLEETELIYSRFTNSTVGVFQHRIASLEGGCWRTCTAIGLLGTIAGLTCINE